MDLELTIKAYSLESWLLVVQSSCDHKSADHRRGLVFLSGRAVRQITRATSWDTAERS